MLNSAVTVSLETNAPVSGHIQYEKISGFYDLFRKMASISSLDMLLDHIARFSIDVLKFRFCRILIAEPDGHFICQASSSIEPSEQMTFKWQRALPAAQAFYQKIILNNEPVFIGQTSALTIDLRYALRLSLDENIYFFPMRASQEAVGILVLGDEHRPLSEPALGEKIRTAEMIADQTASAIYRIRLAYRLEEIQLQTVLALAKVMDSRDPYIGKHSRKVTEIAVQLAQELGCTTSEIQSIRWAALLHDIGKVGISDEILNKKAPLTQEEWSMVRQHPEKGAEIVRMASNLDYVASLILAHHERYDGNGYPNHVKREMIPFGARILAVADTYSAMTDERPYRKSSSLSEVIEELRRCSGTQFDPRIVDAFIRLYKR